MMQVFFFPRKAARDLPFFLEEVASLKEKKMQNSNRVFCLWNEVVHYHPTL
jgi:hypothetical protein